MAIGLLTAGILGPLMLHRMVLGEQQGLSGCHFPFQAIKSLGRRALGIASGSSPGCSELFPDILVSVFNVCLPLKDCPIAVWEAAATQSLMPLPAPVGSFLSLGSRETFYRTF